MSLSRILNDDEPPSRLGPSVSNASPQHNMANASRSSPLSQEVIPRTGKHRQIDSASYQYEHYRPSSLPIQDHSQDPQYHGPLVWASDASGKMPAHVPLQKQEELKALSVDEDHWQPFSSEDGSRKRRRRIVTGEDGDYKPSKVKKVRQRARAIARN